MMQIPNEMIRASAGTGKTYKLTSRFIKLLLCDVPPERIIALTFTRKAAGEFFEGILSKLAKAADDPKEAKQLAKEVGVTGAGSAEFRKALRRLVDTMGQLSLGTIDGFFHRVIAMFSLEFGLGGQFEMMSEFELDEARMSVLESLLDENAATPAGRESLIESYRLSTAGKDDRNFVGSLEQHLENCHELLLRMPDPSMWGNPDRILPPNHPWQKQQVDRQIMTAQLQGMLEEEHAIGQRALKGITAMVDHLDKWAPGKDLFAKSKTLMIRAVDELKALENGDWSFTYGNTNALNCPSAEFNQLLAKIIRHCVAEELRTRLERTQGIHGLLSKFEERYDSRVRHQGRLSFADLPVLLNLKTNKLDLEYRLDGAFDHWLLDEFQDTSRVQWQAIDNLVDEVLQDPEARRGFFCVGDQKQSLYQWRGGDPRLFDRVEEKYSAVIESSSLDKTWRSVPAVLELVNNVFGAETIFDSDMFNRAAGKRWNEGWRKHTSAKPLQMKKGHSMFLTVEDGEDRWEVIRHLLEKLQPIKNGLECAILVQKNDTVREMVNYLRGALPHTPVMGESTTSTGADNALGAALLSLFRAATHPTDKFSLGHLSLTPIDPFLPQEKAERRAELRQILRAIQQAGFEAVAREWVAKLEPHLNAFNRYRGRQFLELARQFDDDGSRNVDAFIRFMTAQTSADTSGANVVQVMTFHKAKGLTFDVTLVPDLEAKNKRLDSTRSDSLHTHSSSDGSPEWILDLPPKEICQCVKPLKTTYELARADACYENFCKLYVALTRSRRGLYVITSQASGSSAYFPRLLTESLAENDGHDFTGSPKPAKVMFESGDFEWLAEWKAEHEPPAPEKLLDPVDTERPFQRMARRRPSAHGGTVFGGASLFEANGSDSAAFGRAVHAIFEEIEWQNEHTASILKTHKETNVPAAAEVERCLQCEEVAALFAPITGAEVWLERAFELVIDGEFCSGVFDRVVLQNDSAHIIDFKTDRVDETAIDDALKRHQPQLELYRRVLSRLTDLPESAITCSLVFTRPAKVMSA